MSSRRGRAWPVSIAGLVLSGALFIVSHPLAAEQSFRVGLRSIYPVASAGFLMAEHLGFYDDVGLDIEFVSQESAESDVVRVQNTLRANRADLAVGGTEVLVDSGDGTPLVAVFTVFQTSAARIFLKRDSIVSTISDLTRLPIILSAPGSRLRIETEAVLSVNGIARDAMNLVVPGPQEDWMQLVLSDEVAGFPGSLFATEYVMDLFGIGLVPVDPGSYGLDFYGETLFATQAFAEAHAESIELFRQASRRGWEYVFENPEAAAEFILATTEQPSLVPRSVVSAEFILWQIAAAERLSGYPVVDVGYSSAGRWHNIAAALEGLGLPNVAEVHDSFVFDYQAILASQRRTTTIVVAVVFGALAAMVIAIAAGRHIATRARVHREIDRLVEGLLQGVAYFRLDGGRFVLARTNRVMRCVLDARSGEAEYERWSPEMVLTHIGLNDDEAQTAVRRVTVEKLDARLDSVHSPDGERHLAVSVFAPSGDSLGISVVDVTAQHTARTALEELVHQRTVTLREIHHRVRNNMQIVASLMNLHGERLSSPEALGFLATMQNEIRALSVAHEMLYDDFTNQRISVESYVHRVAGETVRDLQDRAACLLEYEAVSSNRSDCALIDLDTAIPIGLIVTEAAWRAGMNAAKGCSDTPEVPRKLRVSCELLDDRSIRVIVAEDGTGRRHDESTDDLGIEIMGLLANQIGGDLAITNPRGRGPEVTLLVPGTHVTLGV